jgi:RNA polymerase sigma-70 factor (ECF subfamily)
LLVTLADIEELPYKEIAEIMDTPVGTIRSRLHRTHKMLRAKLESQAKATKPKISTRLALSN